MERQGIKPWQHFSAPSSHGAHPPSPQMVSMALLWPYQDLRGKQRQVDSCMAHCTAVESPPRGSVTLVEEE